MLDICTSKTGIGWPGEEWLAQLESDNIWEDKMSSFEGLDCAGLGATEAEAKKDLLKTAAIIINKLQELIERENKNEL